MKNQEVADILDEIADILEIEGVDWKPRAYRNAALNIRSLSDDIEDLNKKGSLDSIPCVGENIAKKIKEYLDTGKLLYLDKLKKEIPEAVEMLMKIQGIGPKKAKLLYDKLKISSLADLEKAIKQGKLENIKGMGEKTGSQILKGIKTLESSDKRHLLGETLFIAREIESKLKKVDGVEIVELAGSLRRMKETIGDVDILVVSSKPGKSTEFFTKMPEVKKVLWTGHTKSSIQLNSGLQVDLRILDHDHYGSALQYFIGSKEHSVKLRKIAIKKGYKLSEYGLFKGKNIIAAKNEREIYSRLGLQYIPPEMREDRGEIEAALKNKIPNLIELKDIQGDLHMHSSWSDGNNTVDQIISAAREKNYSYIAISDHSEGLKITNGLDEKRLTKQLDEIDRLQKKYPNIKIFKSSEVDIKKDGSLDINQKMLKLLDFVTISVHSSFQMSEKEMTDRVLKAMNNPSVKILGHPSGRLIFKRGPIKLEFHKIFEKAKSSDIAMEINCHPDRLDLNDVNAKAAKDFGVKLAINTDAHIVDHLRNMELGVGTARRAWIEKKDVINAYDLKNLRKFLS